MALAEEGIQYLGTLAPRAWHSDTRARAEIQRLDARDKFNANAGLLTAPKKRAPEVARKYDARFSCQKGG
jgi:hypothetical protein